MAARPQPTPARSNAASTHCTRTIEVVRASRPSFGQTRGRGRKFAPASSAGRFGYARGVEPKDVTVEILKDIREEIRGVREEVRSLRDDTNARFERMDARFVEMNARFEVIETTLRDLAQQMVMLARGIKTALDARADVERRLEDVERRLSDLERRQPS